MNMEFLTPFTFRDTDSGLCVESESSQRGEIRPVDIIQSSSSSSSSSRKRDTGNVSYSMSLSPDHKLCAVGGGNTITVFTTNHLARTLAYKKPSHSCIITDVVWSPHGLFIIILLIMSSCCFCYDDAFVV